MRIRSIVALSASACMLSFKPQFLAADSIDSQRRIEVPATVRIHATGTNCPKKFLTAISADFEAVTLLFSDFLLTTQNPQLLCRIGIDYSFPTGWRMWRPSAFARGYQRLVNAKQQSAWVVRTRLNSGEWYSDGPLISQGPVEDNFVSTVQGGEQRQESPSRCGATSAHIDVEIIAALLGEAVSGETAPLLALDSMDTLIDWQRCP